MKKCRALLTISFVSLSVAGCAKGIASSTCDGFERLTPAPQTRAFIVENDKPFARQIVATNVTLDKCWGKQ